MKQLNNRTEGKEMQTILVQGRICGKSPMGGGIALNSIEAARQALDLSPFFGGTAPEGGAAADAPKKTEDAGSGADDTGAGNSAGGDSALTPEQIAAIVAQNAELAKTTKELTGKLEGYTKQEADAEKAKLGDVERRDREIAERDETIVNMDRVIRNLAVENAINNSKDLKFHSAKHVINELDPTEYEIDVDLKTGVATVSNLEKALKRIADANQWMVVDAAKDNPGNGSATKTGNQNPGGGARRGSGAPPSPGAQRQSDATQRRSELMKKFPVIARTGVRS